MPSHIIHPIPPVLTPTPASWSSVPFRRSNPEKAVFTGTYRIKSFLEALSAPAKERRSSPSRKRRNFCCEPHRRLDTIHSCSIEESSDIPSAMLFQTTASILDHASSRRFTQTAGCPEKCTTASAVNRLALRQSNCPPALPTLPGTRPADRCLEMYQPDPGKPGSGNKNTASDGNAREAKHVI